jgi:hypothetical protein
MGISNFMRILTCGIFMVIFWGCSSQEQETVPLQFQELENLTVYSADMRISTTFSFEKDVIYGDTEDVLIGRIGDVSVDSSSRVYIADTRQMVIHVYEPDGRFIGQLGRDGRGPGEFGSIASLHVKGDRLYAYDPNLQRIHIFRLHDLAGEKTVNLADNRRSYPALAETMPSIREVYIRNDSTYIARFLFEEKSPALQNWQNYEVIGLFYLLNSSGSILGELFEFISEIRTRVPNRSGTVALDVPIESFFGKTVMVVSSDNHIFLAIPDYFLIKQYSPNGAYQQSFFYPISKIPLTQETAVQAEVNNFFINAIQDLDLPEFLPVLTDMKIDNHDRLWVATTVEDINFFEWLVLENTGQLIARFEWPRNKPIKMIKNDYIYTLENDEETGLQQIVRYRIKSED